MTSRVLIQRLREQGYLAQVDADRGKNVVRVTLEGSRKNVLALKTSALMGEERAHQAHRAHSPAVTGVSGPELWARTSDTSGSRAQISGPQGPEKQGGRDLPGPDGPNGPEMEGIGTSCEMEPSQSSENLTFASSPERAFFPSWAGSELGAENPTYKDGDDWGEV